MMGQWGDAGEMGGALLEERRPQGTGQPGTHVIAVMLGAAWEWAWHPLPGTGSLLPAAQ